MTAGRAIRPVAAKRAWTRSDVEGHRDWASRLTPAVCDELRRAVADARQRGLDSRSPELNDRELPGLRSLARSVVGDLREGLGFHLLKGLPIGGLSLEESRILLMLVGRHLGIVTPQTGDRPEIGEVMDTGPGRKMFYYERGGAIPMHMDPVDVVGLLCIRKAKRGGESGISSSMAVHNEILRSRPELLDILYRGYRHHRRHRAGDRERKILTDYYCPIFFDLEDEVVCSIIPHVIEGAVEEGLTRFTPIEAEALEYFKSTAARDDFRMHMDLEPGDLQLLNNRAILHNRLDYEDFPEPERRRLLLRLWVTIPGWEKLPAEIPHMDAELGTRPA